MAVRLRIRLEVDHTPTLNHVFTEARGHRLEYQWLGAESNSTPIVFLHEGLGSIDLWRGFPAEVVAESDHPGLVFSRYGHGRSDPLIGPRSPRFMHDEALEVLPGLVDELVGRAPILVGHSDGASISVIYAGSGYPAAGLVLIAPHVMVEEIGLLQIAELKESHKTSDLVDRLANYHDKPEALFRGWADVWLSDEFRDWNLEEYLPGITCPVLLIQSREDDYGTLVHLDLIETTATGRVERLELVGRSHSPHLSQGELVTETTVQFIKEASQARTRPT